MLDNIYILHLEYGAFTFQPHSKRVQDVFTRSHLVELIIRGLETLLRLYISFHLRLSISPSA